MRRKKRAGGASQFSTSIVAGHSLSAKTLAYWLVFAPALSWSAIPNNWNGLKAPSPERSKKSRLRECATAWKAGPHNLFTRWSGVIRLAGLEWNGALFRFWTFGWNLTACGSGPRWEWSGVQARQARWEREADHGSLQMRVEQHDSLAVAQSRNGHCLSLGGQR